MIHHVPRDEIRMVSGEVIITDPLKEITWDEMLPDLLDFARRIQKVMGNVDYRYIVVRNYDQLYSPIASSPCLVLLRNIATITSKVAEIDADESVRFPIVNP